jgi:hypothetical protein
MAEVVEGLSLFEDQEELLDFAKLAPADRKPVEHEDELLVGDPSGASAWVVCPPELGPPITSEVPTAPSDKLQSWFGFVSVQSADPNALYIKRRRTLGLPPTPFMYTLDQLAHILQLSVDHLGKRHLYFKGRSMGQQKRHEMLAVNLAAPGDPPDWRVADHEFVEWCSRKGFTVVDAWNLAARE